MQKIAWFLLDKCPIFVLFMQSQIEYESLKDISQMSARHPIGMSYWLVIANSQADAYLFLH